MRFLQDSRDHERILQDMLTKIFVQQEAMEAFVIRRLFL
jgi:hypothetical protein